MAYEHANPNPIEKIQLELLGRIADALEGIRFALVSKIITPMVPPANVPVVAPYPQIGGQTIPNPFRAPETHVRRVLTESETENPKLGWKPYEEQKNKE